jgi:N-acetylmuramoyl-L-alanine amidase
MFGMNSFIRLLGAFLSVFLLIGMPVSAKSTKFTVVIDPGHGGKDPGAIGARSKEKDIVLSVSKKLGALIEKNHDDVEVIYTRKSDIFVPLDRRATIANNAKADLFISLHCNALSRKQTSPQGVETFILGLHRSQDNLEVAKKENSVILLEDDYSQKYAGFDPSEPESYIIFEYMSNQYLKQSLDLASLVQRKLVNSSGRRNRNVRQAGFLVLREVAMPSILIELGYISNRNEEQYLMSASGQSSMAESIYQAFREYKKNFDKKSIGIFVSDPNLSETSTVQATEDQVAGVTEYRIQFLISSKEIPVNSSRFKGLSPVSYYKDGKVFKYTYGSSTDQKEILNLLKEVRRKFPDAFVVEFRDGKRIK